MKHIVLVLTVLFIAIHAHTQEDEKWKLFAVTEGVEVYIDTTSIKRIENKSDDVFFRYAVTSKKIYADSIGKNEYLSKIRTAFAKSEKKESKIQKKMKKWNDVKYTLIEYVYDCVNRRFRTISIADYDSRNKLIVKTKTPKTTPWTDIAGDDVGDLMMFYVCDYDQ
ncbi:MAG: surface-adhesin E family protein [Dysgonomonas sp.]